MSKQSLSEILGNINTFYLSYLMYKKNLASEIIRHNQIITFNINEKVIKSSKLDQHQ